MIFKHLNIWVNIYHIPSQTVQVFHFKNWYIAHILSVFFICFLTFAVLFFKTFLFSLFFCYAPIYQGKFLAYENTVSVLLSSPVADNFMVNFRVK